jgi:hypothetical protein
LALELTNCPKKALLIPKCVDSDLFEVVGAQLNEDVPCDAVLLKAL